MIVLFGGAAGSGKTTIARLWSRSRVRSVHIQLDKIRDLIISGLVDPQVQTAEQSAQYNHSVDACAALARSYADSGYDIAIDDVFEPEPTRRLWLPRLHGLDVRLVILHPPMEVALKRITNREKQVFESNVRSQYEAMSEWSSIYVIDNGELTPEKTLGKVEVMLEHAKIE